MKKPLFLFLALSSTSLVAQAASIPILGVARNITTSKPLSGASVRLVQPNDKGQREVIATAQTDANGRFQFAPRDYGKTQVLMTEVTHGGMDYWRLAYDGGNVLKSKMGLKIDPKNVDLQVFDTTTKAIPLDFQVHHLAVETSPNGLKCVERIVVQNASKTTLLGVGPNRVTVMLDLPKPRRTCV
jgi:5-hydroxyisourate hydrolase-like protein (transthyretin family)